MNNTKIKICKNKYGWYKLQMWYPEKKFLFFFTSQGKWKDTYFPNGQRKCKIFKTFTEAEDAREKVFDLIKEKNNDWCEVKG
ncbi:MAG: hypothetical protein JJW03_05190 [Desulfosarcina sp.]|nr:hypothetical protein [Desulfobacterales bacterium]